MARIKYPERNKIQTFTDADSAMRKLTACEDSSIFVGGLEMGMGSTDADQTQDEVNGRLRDSRKEISRIVRKFGKVRIGFGY